MEQRPVPGPERPRVEPEIIPPGEARARWEGRTFYGSERVYVARLGPFGVAMLTLALAAFAALVLVVMLGAFLVAIPLAGLLLAAAVISGLWRGWFRRRQRGE